MVTVLRPESAEQVRQIIAWAAAEGEPLALRALGSKTEWGGAVESRYIVELLNFRAIHAYEPEELVLTCGAGITMAALQEVLDERRQMLAFEPPDFGPLFGGAANAGTLGGAVLCNLAGPRRIQAGAARDHFLGFQGVSGRGEAFKGGGKVVKNVTGYDLCKLMAGSFGTLAALTELTVKVMPHPEKSRTVLLFGLDTETAIAALARAAGSPHEVSGLAHLPADMASRSSVSYVACHGVAVSAIRIEGPGPSVEYRTKALREMFAGHQSEELHSLNSALLWREVRDCSYFIMPRDRVVWRVLVAPSAAPAVVAALRSTLADMDVFLDWGGGLIWLSHGAKDLAEEVRPIVERFKGHAQLFRASADLKARLGAFHPGSPALAALSRRVKASFDPAGILNPGRMMPKEQAS